MSVLDVEGKRIVVVGLGASGVAAARLCLRRGARVVANDSKPYGALSDAARALVDLGAEVIAGDHDSARLTEADAIVVSPGVPPLSQVKAAMACGVPVVGEIELATQLLAHRAPVVAIGGTNGKSTTTSLVGAMLLAQGKRTFVGEISVSPWPITPTRSLTSSFSRCRVFNSSTSIGFTRLYVLS